jgi:anti-sigma B factor antagonist
MAFTEVGMESLDLDLEPISAGDCTVVRVTGDIDLSTAPGLRAALNRPGADHVVVDLRGVTFLDSTGLGVLVGALKRLRRQGGSLKVVINRGGRVRRLFELTNLSGAFDLHTSVLDAIASDTNWQAATGSRPKDWCLQRGLR